MREELQTVMESLEQIPREELPRLLGELEEIRSTAQMRLLSQAADSHSEPDRFIGVEEAAALLGMSADYLYRHHHKFPFSRRIGRRLLFSLSGLKKYQNRSIH